MRSVVITDITGRQVKNASYNVNSTELIISVSELSTGTYFIRMVSDSGNIIMKKFVKG